MSAALTIREDLLLLAPELALLTLACLTLLCDAFSNDPDRKLTFWLAEFSLLAVMLLVAFPFAGAPCIPDCGASLAFQGHFISDSLSVALKVAVCAGDRGGLFSIHTTISRNAARCRANIL